MQAPQQSVDQRAFRNVIPLAIWTLVWLASLAVARFGPELLWSAQPVASWIAIAGNVAVGVGWMVAHARYLGGVDDLQRKILLEAIAVAFGVGLVVGFAYAAANAAGLFSLDAAVGYLAALMAVVYSLATVAGTVRYR